MSRAEENRKKMQQAVITMPSGNRYLVRRPLFPEIREATPTEEPGPATHDRNAAALERLFAFIEKVALDPLMVADDALTDPAKQMTRSEVERAGDHQDFLRLVIARFFGADDPAADPFRYEPGVARGD
jgi:hypothetical protein